MARNRPVKLASARALAARAACKRVSLSCAKRGRGVGFRCGSAGGGNVGEFDMFRAVSARPTLGLMLQACRLWFEYGFALFERHRLRSFPAPGSFSAPAVMAPGVASRAVEPRLCH